MIKYLSLIAISFMLCACAHQVAIPYAPPQASSAGIDNGIATITKGVKDAQDAAAKERVAADNLYSSVTNATTNKAVWQEVVDLRGLLSNSETSLAETASNVVTLTSKVQWYEVNYSNTYGSMTNAIAGEQVLQQQNGALKKSASFWRSWAFWASLVVLGFVGYFALPYIMKLLGAAAKA